MILGANLGATRANDFPRRADEYGQAAGVIARSRTGPDDAERLTGIYGSEGWGFESLRARPGQRPFALLAAALLLTDLLTPASSLAGIERAKMSAAAAT